MTELIKKVLLNLIKGITSLFLILFIVSALVLALEIRIALNFLNKPIEVAAERILDREIFMQGDVVLIPTLWPTLEIQNVSIGNPKQGQWTIGNKMAHFGRLRLQLGLLPLLSGEIHVADMLAESVILNLENDSKGVPNWVFERPSDNTSQADLNTEDVIDSESVFHFEALDSILFKQINVHYIDQAINKLIHFNLEQLEGKASSGEEILLTFHGHLQDKKFQVNLQGGSLDVFRDPEQNWPLTMQMKLAGTQIELSGELKAGKDRELSASLDIGETDIGATLKWFQVIDGLQTGAKRLTMTANIQGDSLSEILNDAELSFVLKNAWWNITDANTGGLLPIKITEGTIKVNPRKPVQIQLNGLLDQSRIKIHITGAPLLDYTRKEVKTALSLSVNTHETDLTLKTSLLQAMEAKNLSFNMVLKGNKLSDLNQLTKMDLPPLGPYSLQGYYAADNKGYQIKNLLLKVKDSQLKGNFSFDTRAKPPYLVIDLHSKKIQINNFDMGEWSPVAKDKKETKKDDAKAKTEKTNKLKKIETANREKTRKLLSHETLSRFNADIKLNVDQVLSGKDVLGNGLLFIKQKNARFELNLEKLTLPGGEISADFSYYPSGNKQIDTSLDLKVKGFDYGILARRVDEKSEVGGRVSLDVELASKNVNSLNSLLTQSEGHIDFSWAPEAMDADLFEMWAVNLMASLLESADKEKSSKVNCVIGRFVLDQGMMKDKVIFVDSTKMRMMGTAEANFQDRSIKVNLTPQAKRPEFFSLATSVGLSGTFDKFHISLNPLSLTATVVSFISSPLHVPVRRLFTKGLPEDGHEACKAIWDVSDEIDDKAEKPLAKPEFGNHHI